MLDFIYNTPTKVYFGRDKEKEVGKIIKELLYRDLKERITRGEFDESR
jgi:alcohol dehydrogenase YqhD (iron-dependent ADH family)